MTSSPATAAPPTAPPRARVGRLAAASIVLALLGVGVAGQPAWAHGGDPSEEGYVIVQQALSYLVTDPTPAGSSEALMKIDAVLAAEDQDGVNVSEVQRAQEAINGGDRAAGQALLQSSIAEAIAALPAAVGEETGTTVVVGPYVAQPGLTAEGLIFLILSLLVAIGGAILAAWLRPHEGLRQLSRDIRDAAQARDQLQQPRSNGRDNHDH